MKSVIDRLSYLIESVPEQVSKYSAEAMSTHLPGKWSKKEILGHLCDSASNNHHRLVKIQFEPQPFKAAGYDQNNWQRVQDYQSVPVKEIVALWVCLNRHFLRVLQKISPDKFALLCDIGEGEPVTLQWLIEDYLHHLEHHLNQILA